MNATKYISDYQIKCDLRNFTPVHIRRKSIMAQLFGETLKRTTGMKKRYAKWGRKKYYKRVPDKFRSSLSIHNDLLRARLEESRNQ